VRSSRGRHKKGIKAAEKKVKHEIVPLRAGGGANFDPSGPEVREREEGARQQTQVQTQV